MNDITFIAFLQDWLSTIITILLGIWITNGLRGLKKSGQRRDNVAKLTEIRVEGIAHALSNAPDPIGTHFKAEYEKKVNQLLVAEKFVDTNGSQ